MFLGLIASRVSNPPTGKLQGKTTEKPPKQFINYILTPTEIKQSMLPPGFISLKNRRRLTDEHQMDQILKV
jgi:hypothetical protein